MKRTRLVQTDRLIVAVEGDIAWLTTKGKVYQLVDTDEGNEKWQRRVNES